MRRRVDKRLQGFARSMRRKPTDAERRLWSRLRNGRLAGLKFRRQAPIGNAIADFICYERMLIVELDGGQHAESKYDEHRDAELKRRGFHVLRIWNGDLLRKTDETLEWIRTTAERLPPHPPRLSEPAAVQVERSSETPAR